MVTDSTSGRAVSRACVCAPTRRMSSPRPGIRRPSYNGAPAMSASVAFKKTKAMSGSRLALYLPRTFARPRPVRVVNFPAPQRARARMPASLDGAPKTLSVRGQRRSAALIVVRLRALRAVMLFVWVRDLADVDDREQHEDEGLHESHEQTERHDEDGQQQSVGRETEDRPQNLLVAEEVAEQTYAERHRAH